MFNKFFGLFSNYNSSIVRKYRKIVDTINDYEEAMVALSDSELANKTNEFKEALEQGKTLDDILPEAFAVVREASKRILGMRHFDVQVIGGIALHNAQIAEMKTGEGKTLVATLAVYLNALTGKGVHVITVNDYLATRDAAWMGQVYNFLGLSVATIVSGMSDSQKREAYAADISYGTNHEFGFDYLRDNLKFREEDMVMRPFNFAVIDEVDSILIDEARTPLIISGADDNASQLYIEVDKVVKTITEEDYEKDEKMRVVTLTDKGVERIEKGLMEKGLLKAPSLYDPSNITIVYHVNCALKALKIFKRDVDYMVKDNQVLIIDEFTGRVLDGRRYSEGLHQAIEAKEGVPVQTESQTIATISYQNLFRLYPKLSGMTGTAMTEEAEFEEIYKLKVVSIPPNKPVIRIDHDDSMFVTMAEKDRAVLALIKECHAKGQPLLVGTTSLERSEYFSKLLTAEGIKHNVLNAKHHEKEARIVAEAGAPGAVTIATNMAGRGTDIKLGGNAEMRIEDECASITDPVEKNKRIEEIKAEVAKAYDEVAKAGGLFVIGTERNESRRIDNQLRGRSGRQGDPGASKYFVSLEDDLMRRFSTPNLINRFKKVCKDDEELSHRWISKAIAKAQQRVEAYNFDIRKQLLKYDDVMNDQRKMVYDLRRSFMKSDDISPQIQDMIEDVLDDIVMNIAPQGSVPMDWNIDQLAKDMDTIFKVAINKEEIANDPVITAEVLRQRLGDAVMARRKSRIEKYGDPIIRYVEKDIALKTLDIAWKNHLVVMEHLRRGINLRAYAQKNPLNEYKFEAFTIFQEMFHQIKIDILTVAFGFELKLEDPEPSSSMTEFNEDSNMAEPSSVKEDQTSSIKAPASRNAPCPCGSGKRYKHCHGALDSEFEPQAETDSKKKEQLERTPSKPQDSTVISEISKDKPKQNAKSTKPATKRTEKKKAETAKSEDPAKVLHDFISAQRKKVLSGEPMDDEEEEPQQTEKKRGDTDN